MKSKINSQIQDRSSIKQEPGIWSKLRPFFCPCFSTSSSPARKQQQVIIIDRDSKSQRSSVSERRSFGMIPQSRFTYDQDFPDAKRESLLDKKSIRSKPEVRETLNMSVVDRMSYLQKDFSIYNYVEDQLISIGIKDNHLLVKISRVDVKAKPMGSIIKKESSSREPAQSPIQRRSKKDIMQKGSYQLEKFWSKRYQLFERFDQGVKIDDLSWARIPPERVSQHIANKFAGAKVILDGFAGVGGTTVRLAHSACSKQIIANDFNRNKLTCLINNARVYDVDSIVEISEKNFLDLELQNIDLVYVHPPLVDKECYAHKSISIVDFLPELDKVIKKCFSLAPNVMMLLPPQVSVDTLCSCIHKCAIEQGKMKESCSVIIQKLYFEDELRYLLVALGPAIRKDIKLSDELEFIYSKLKKTGEKAFKYKKLVKKIREEFGMLFLLNLVKQSEKRAKQKISKSGIIGKVEFHIDSFFEIIEEKKLLSKSKLEKLKEEPFSNEKRRDSAPLTLNEYKPPINPSMPLEPVMEEEKYEDPNDPMEYRASVEQTISEYSHYSYMEGLKESMNSHHSNELPMRQMSDSFSSVIIKRAVYNSRQKSRDKSRGDRSRGKSRGKEVGRYEKNRVSQAYVPVSKRGEESKVRSKKISFQGYHRN